LLLREPLILVVINGVIAVIINEVIANGYCKVANCLGIRIERGDADVHRQLISAMYNSNNQVCELF